MTYIFIKETGINRKITKVMSRIARLKRYRRLDLSIWWYRMILLRWSGILFTSSMRQPVGKARYSCENVVKVHAMQLYMRTLQIQFTIRKDIPLAWDHVPQWGKRAQTNRQARDWGWENRSAFSPHYGGAWTQANTHVTHCPSYVTVTESY